MINAGELNKYVTVQQQTITRDSYGAETITWTTYANVWAKIESLTGKEFFSKIMDVRNSEVTHRVIVRYSPGINPRMRVKLGNKYLDIMTVINPGAANESLELMCREVVV